jgi:hypothetical protein
MDVLTAPGQLADYAQPNGRGQGPQQFTGGMQGLYGFARGWNRRHMRTLACDNEFHLGMRRSVVVPVTLVGRVAVPVVHVIRVVVVRHGDMPALRAVLMGVPVVNWVLRPGAFVDVVGVRAVDVAVVRVVGVVVVRDRDVAAAVTVDVLMAGMGAVVNGSGHHLTPHSHRQENWRSVNSWQH